MNSRLWKIGIVAVVLVLVAFWLNIPQSQYWLVQQYNATQVQKQIAAVNERLKAIDDAVKKYDAIPDKTSAEAQAEKARIQTDLAALKAKAAPAGSGGTQ